MSHIILTCTVINLYKHCIDLSFFFSDVKNSLCHPMMSPCPCPCVKIYLECYKRSTMKNTGQVFLIINQCFCISNNAKTLNFHPSPEI